MADLFHCCFLKQQLLPSFGILQFHNPHICSLKQRRRSHHKLLAKPTTTRTNSVSSEIDIISTTVCTDGSVVFHFGNACEFEQKAKLEEVKVLHGGVEEANEPNELSGRVHDSEGKEKVVRNNHEIRMIEKKIDESTVCIEDNGGVENVSNVSGTDCKPMADKQLLEDTVVDSKTGDSSVSVLGLEMGKCLELGNGSDLHLDSHEASEEKSEAESGPPLNTCAPESIIEVPTSDTLGNGSDLHLDSHEDFEEKSEAESGPPLNTCVPESIIEVPTSDTSQSITKDSDDIKLMNLSMPSEDCSLDRVMFNVIGEDSDVGDLVEALPTSLEAEQIPNEDTDCETMEELVEADGTESLIMTNEGTQSANFEAEVNKFDTQNNVIIDNSAPKSVEFELIEGALQREELSTSELFLFSGASSMPHPSKGEGMPILFHARIGLVWLMVLVSGHQKAVSTSVMDFVLSLLFSGSDAGQYAHELMENCEEIVSDCNKVITNSKELLTRSAAEAQSPGFSTVLVAYFDGQVLDVGNIGDSGFIIIRNGMVFKKSSPMVHELHFPLRIEKGDEPSELIEEYKINLDDGDVIIIATDGLFDNLYEKEIASTVTKSLQDNWGPKEIAEFLATRAQEVGRSSYARSPFADAAQAAGYVGYTGGKLDDVTVIVSLVQKGSSSRPRPQEF